MTVGFWPARDPAQVDYERLRAVALAGGDSVSVTARRFARRGLAGIIAWPSCEPVFAATLTGAERPAWTPHADPRLDALASGYGLLLAGPPAESFQRWGADCDPERRRDGSGHDSHRGCDR